MSGAQDQGSMFVRLTRAQALVLFEWLVRVDAAGGAPVEDPAEQQVLWQLEGQLESILSEPLGPNYKEMIAAARKEVREGKQMVDEDVRLTPDQRRNLVLPSRFVIYSYDCPEHQPIEATGTVVDGTWRKTDLLPFRSTKT